MTQPASNLLRATEIEQLAEDRFVHQFNPRAIRHTRSLGDLLGLEDVGIHLVRVAPGDETTQYHYHELSDEFIYILEGRATAVIDDQTFEVGPGDFMGFPKNGPAHTMSNTGDQDLLYLVGGSRVAVDIVNYPRLNRRMYSIHGRREYADLDDLTDVPRR